MKLIEMAKISHPQSGPPLHKSNTWCGLSNFLKLLMSWRPWPPPLFPFTNTNSGHTIAGSMDGFTVGNNITGIQNISNFVKKFNWCIRGALKLEKSAISKVQKHIFCIFKNGKKSIFAPEKV